MKASINVDDFKRMLKNADKITDGRGSNECIAGKIVLSVHDGKFEVFALVVGGSLGERRIWMGRDHHADGITHTRGLLPPSLILGAYHAYY